jgi:hypothetical protein
MPSPSIKTTLVDYRKIEQEIIQGHKREPRETDPIIESALSGRVLPALRRAAVAKNVDEWTYRSKVEAIWLAASNLMWAIWLPEIPTKSYPSKVDVWCHQKFDLMKVGDYSIRGFSLLREMFASAAAEYLENKEGQCSYLDWCLLDMLVFCELDAWGYAVMLGRGVSPNWAFTFCNGKRSIYLALGYLFGILSILINVGVPVLIGKYLFGLSQHGLMITTAVFLLFWICGYFYRARSRTHNFKLLGRILDVYLLLGESTISPRKLKETADQAFKDGVGFDNAVYSLIDRMMKRDPTVFIVPRDESWEELN